jgi:hypothetical protein
MESIETLNTRLVDFFGTDSNSGKPMFRIVWANDETEKRMVGETENGVQLLFAEVRLVKKYPYLKDLYLLEQLVAVPDMNIDELPTQKLSYEPLWAYCNDKRIPRPPTWPATKLIIDTMFAVKGVHSLRKYVDSELNTTEDGRQERIKLIHEELFGDETETGDALRYKEGIVVPNSYQSTEEKQ